MQTAEIISATAAKPLHTWQGPGLEAQFVSRVSRWGDVRWIFDNPTPGSRANISTIAWNIRLQGVHDLTDPEYSDLLDWLRRFVWTLFAAPGDGASALRPGSAFSVRIGLGIFVPWLVRNGYARPQELNAQAVEAYRSELPERLAETAASDDETGISVAQARHPLRILTLLWRQRKALAAAGIPPMPSNPWNGRSANDLAAEIATKANGWIKPLPDEVAIPLLNKAAWFLSLPAQDIIRLHDACYESYHRAPGNHPNGPGIDRGRRTKRQQASARAFRFSVLPGEDGPWHPPLKARVTDEAKAISVFQRVRQLVLALRDAAVITVLAGTGMRISEICGLPAGIDQKTNLPTCVRIEKSATELNELFIVRTLLAKTEEIPREVDWVIGMRPAGSNEMPLPVQALLILNHLLAPYRALNRSNRLLVSFTTTMGLPKSVDGVGRITSERLLGGIRNFVKEWVDLSALPDQSAHPAEENDLVQYRESQGACIGTHQFRKLYANFALSTDTRLLMPLQMHFHHLSQAMTEGGYWGRNALQVEPLSTVQRQQTNMLMFELATGRSLVAGHMGEHLDQDENIAQLRKLLKHQSITEGWKTTARFVNDYDLRLWFTPHGKCLPLIPEKMRCHEVAGTTSWLNKEPNYTTREPSICASCACFILDARHAPFWQERYVQNWLSFRQAERRGEGGQFRLIRERAAQARALLMRIGIDTAPLEARVERDMNYAT